MAIVSAQTKVTPPVQQVHGCRRTSSSVRRPPAKRDGSCRCCATKRVDSYIERLGQRLVAAIPGRSAPPGFQLHVRSRERPRHQRVRAARRADVRQPRHDRSGEDRRRGRRRHGARDQPRRAAPRHGAGEQGDEVPDRPDRRRASSARSSAATGARSISQGTQFGLGTAFMRYGREYEQQADIEGRADHGARRLRPARHGQHVQDDREAVGRLRRPEWLSDHPNPGNRSAYITKEARAAPCQQPGPRHAPRSTGSRRACGRCRRRRRPRKRRATDGGRTRSRGDGNPAQTRRPDASPRRRRAIPNTTEGGLFRVSVPSNWRELASNSSVTFAPDGAYGALQRAERVHARRRDRRRAQRDARTCSTATDELIDSLAESNPRLRRESGLPAAIGGRKEWTADRPEQRVGRDAPARKRSSSSRRSSPTAA